MKIKKKRKRKEELEGPVDRNKMERYKERDVR